ncbi:MAG TPA: endonuclease/exonuclease/phosphatase family protein [Saprospiraceae bacterium]|nr:endonuclease/exonuclease/phosphatase family protein [Saprospiraceae bacterium]HND89854.1 endonuclease/exonuclease/phosphatase family protein [Saprospiraceae bacterium]
MKISLCSLLLLLPLLAFSQKDKTSKANKDEYAVAAVGFYNLENLFDTLDSPLTLDEDFLPSGRLLWDSKKYLSKQANMAKVISQLGTELSPDGLAVLGVAEIENRKVLEDLIAQPELKARNYQIVHYESPDERGIDCAFLYQAKYFHLIGSKAFPVKLVDESTGKEDFTRDIVCMSGRFDGEMMHFMVGHWPSRRGGESGSAPARMAAALVCKHIADSLSAADPAAKIIVMGDLNDDPTNKSLTEGMQARFKSEDLKPGEFYNTMYDHYKKGDGTMAYRDSWSLFDQMLVSGPLVSKKLGGWQLYKSIVWRQPWLLQTEGAFRGYPFRTFVGDLFINGYSDHLPVYLFLLKKKEGKP